MSTFWVLFLEDCGCGGQDMSHGDRKSPAWSKWTSWPSLEWSQLWEQGEKEKGRLVSPSQARIFHRLTFSAQGCPQSIQSRLKEVSRRGEALLGDLQRPLPGNHQWSYAEGVGGCLLCCALVPNPPLLWNVCAVF